MSGRHHIGREHLDWIVEVKWEEINGFFQPMKKIYRTCPACQDTRVVKASEIYDGYCPKCGQKMERPGTMDKSDSIPSSLSETDYYENMEEQKHDR